MKLAVWARLNGVHPQTAYRWFGQGRMPVPARRLPSGTIWVDAAPARAAGGVVLYARVPGHDQRRDLDRLLARLAGWAAANGHVVAEVVTEVGSGLNGRRPKLRWVLSARSASVIVVEFRDRLARLGVEHREAALAARRVAVIVVAGEGETTGGLVREMIEVLTGRCARLFGRRGARNRAMRAVTAVKKDPAAEAA